MARRVLLSFIAVVVVSLMLGGCSKKERPIALYVLEELEEASAVKKPEDRITRLGIFIRNHSDHAYRSLAYQRALDAMRDELKDEAGAGRYIADALERETDVSVRGDILYAKFSRLYVADSTAALALVRSLFPVERSPRLFLYVGYELMARGDRSGLAERCFLKSADLYDLPILRSQAIAMAGTYLESIGKTDEAKQRWTTARGNPGADAAMGKLLWSEGKRQEAFEAYIRAAARMPGMRAYARLDSLYAILSPGATDLGDKILALRIVDEGPFPGGQFVDLNGRPYDLSKSGGVKMVINALSPT